MKMTVLKRNAVLSAALLLVTQLTVFAQATRERFDEDYTRAACIWHSYEFRPVSDTRPPKGYKPFYISHYGRHGCRYHASDYFFGDVPAVLHIADSLGNLTDDGMLLKAQVDSLLEIHDKQWGELTDRGAHEHRLIAERMYDRFPQVFKDSERNLVEAYSSDVRRCVVSMGASTGGLIGRNPELEIRYSTGPKCYEYLCLGKVSRETRKYFDVFMNKELSDIPGWDKTLAAVFKDPSKAGIAPFAFADKLWSIWAICGCIDIVDVDIFRYMTRDQLYNMWRIRSEYAYLKHIRSDVYGTKNMDEVSVLLADFLDKADAAVAGNGVAATLRYGHDTTLMPLAAAVGVDAFHPECSMDSRPTAFWDLGTMIGMGSNLQMVFYRDKDGNVLVKVLYNEQERTLPALTPVYGGLYYKWEDVRKHFMDRINNIKRNQYE